jgi:hypothetical protein
MAGARHVCQSDAIIEITFRKLREALRRLRVHRGFDLFDLSSQLPLCHFRGSGNPVLSVDSLKDPRFHGKDSRSNSPFRFFPELVHLG